MKVNPELIKYVQKHVFPFYEEHVSCHDIKHIEYVIRRSLEFAKRANDENINLDMAYTIAAYHDLGNAYDRKTHEKISAQMLRDDKQLDKFFTPEQKQDMAIAVEDHRASANHTPRNIYGKIVSSADRHTTLEDFMDKMYKHNLKHNPQYDLDELIEESRKFALVKFGENGYANAKMFFQDAEYERFISETIRVAKDPEEFRVRFMKINGL